MREARLRYLTLSVAVVCCISLASTPLAAQTCFNVGFTILGTPGPDSISGTTGNDVIVALGGNDVVFSSHGFDRVCGNEGHDKLYGGNGTDFCVVKTDGVDNVFNCETVRERAC